MTETFGEAVIEGLNIGRSGGTVRFKVKDIEADTWADMVSKATSAPNIPQKNSPVLPGLVVLDHPRVVEVPGSSTAVVEINVGKKDDDGGGGGLDVDEVKISYDTTVTEVQTQLDLSGKAIRVFYVPGKADKNAVQINGYHQHSPGHGYAPMQGGQVAKREPVDVLRMERFEDTHDFIVNHRDDYLGHTNKKKFWGKDAGAWLMTRMAVSLSVVKGKLTRPFPVTYEWQSRQDGWAGVSFYKVKETGNPPADADFFKINARSPRIRLEQRNRHQDFYNGYTVVRVQGFADMEKLGLPKLK